MNRPTGEAFRIAIVPGVTPDKWTRTWRQRVRTVPIEVLPVDESDQVAVLYDGRANMSFVRLPIDREGLHLIPMYRETPVVVVPADHPVAAYDEVDMADLAGEHLLGDPEVARPLSPRQAVGTVAAGGGVLIVPQSVARQHHRKDVVHRPVTGVPDSQIGLAWRVEDDDARIETFIGIVRGRTERSSRGNDADRRGRRRR